MFNIDGNIAFSVVSFNRIQLHTNWGYQSDYEEFTPDFNFLIFCRTFTPMPEMAEGRTSLLLFGGLTEADQAQFNFLNYLKIFVNTTELLLRELGYSVQVYILADFERTTIQHHLARAKPLLLRDFYYYILVS